MRLIRHVLVLVLALAPLMGQASEQRRYVVLVDGGKKAGELQVQENASGLIQTQYIFKDNGRGPEIKEEYRLATDASFLSYRAQGTSTFGAAIDESFIREGAQARWTTRSENESRTLQGSAVYVPVSGSPEVNSVLIRALAKRKDQTLPLLPDGRLTQQKIIQLELKQGEQKQKVQLLVLQGLDLEPELVWATVGPEPRLFAALSIGYSSLIREGWESHIASLEAKQKETEKLLLAERASSLQEQLPGVTVITQARVFDSDKAQLTPPMDVYLKNGVITALVPTGSKPQNATTRIDAEGRVLLPGLFDMHAHLGAWQGSLHLAAGVTTVRDLGNDNQTLQQLMTDADEGKVLAPQIVPAGFLEGESPFSARNGFQIKNLEEAKRAIDWYAQNGYPQLKIYNSFPKEILRETVAYAHSLGMRVSGHVPAFMRAEDVIEQGFDEIQHVNQVLLNFFVKPETDTRTLERFYLVANQTAQLDFASAPVTKFIELLKQRSIVIDPTLVAFDFIKHRDGEIKEPFAAIDANMPITQRRGFRTAEMNIPDSKTADLYTRSFRKMVEFIGLLYRSGVPLVAGTDELAGFTLHSELALYVQAGLTPAQALQIATKNGALYSRAPDRGQIAPGKRADVVLIDGDPTRNIQDLHKTALVITRGQMLSPSRIYESLGIKPFTSYQPKIERTKQQPKNASSTKPQHEDKDQAVGL